MDRNKVKKRLFFWYSILWVFIFIAFWESYFIYFPNTTTTKSKWVGLFIGAVAILTASCKINEVVLFKYKDVKLDDSIKKLTNLAKNFTFKNQIAVIIFLTILLIICYKLLGIKFAVCMISGMISHYLTNKIVVFSSINSAVKAENIPDEKLNLKCKLMYNASGILGLFNTGLSLSLIVILFHIYKDYQVINGFILGYFVISVFGNLNRIMSKKAVDDANVAVEMVENNLSENNNPLQTIKVLFDCIQKPTVLNSEYGLIFVCAVIAAMTVGAETLNLQGAFFPIIVSANGIFASILSIVFVRFNKITPVKKALITVSLSEVVFCGLSFYCVKTWFPDFLSLIYPIIIGGLAGFIFNLFNLNRINCTSVQKVVNASTLGYASVFLQASKEGCLKILPYMLLGGTMLILSFILSDGINAPLLGIWGITLSILSVCSLSAINITTDLFANKLSNLNNNCKYLPKNTFINFISILTVLSLLIAYSLIIGLEEIDILNPYVMASFIFGIAMPYIFLALIFGGITKSAKNLAFEVKKQFRSSPQILRGEILPDYKNCIKIALKDSNYCLITALVLISTFTFLVAFILKTEALAGFVMGTLISVSGVIFLFDNVSNLLESAKKYFQKEFLTSEKNNDYDILNKTNYIFSDFSKIALYVFNIIIKYIAILALVFAPLFL